MSQVYKLSFNYRFEAAHRFTKSCADSCATPHGHTWYAKAVFAAHEERLAQSLENDAMVMEFAKLKTSWKMFIQDTVDHSFMHHFEDPILPALRDAIPAFRGLPFPFDPTTELIATLFFSKLQAMHEVLPGFEAVKPSAIVIRETPTNRITFRASHAERSLVLKLINEKYEGWWQSADPADRSFRLKV